MLSQVCVKNSVDGEGCLPLGTGRGCPLGSGGGMSASGSVGGFTPPQVETPPPYETTTATEGTHPTGIHSCVANFSGKVYRKGKRIR